MIRAIAAATTTIVGRWALRAAGQPTTLAMLARPHALNASHRASATPNPKIGTPPTVVIGIRRSSEHITWCHCVYVRGLILADASTMLHGGASVSPAAISC